MQRLQRLGILEQHGTIDLFQFLAALGQKLVEVTNGLLIGTHVCRTHLGKSSIHTFERIQVLGQSDLGGSEGWPLFSGEKRILSPRFDSPGLYDSLFLAFVLSGLKHLVNVLDKLLNVLNRTLNHLHVSIWQHTMYLDLVLVCVAVHLAHTIPDCPTSTLDTCLKCLESSADAHMFISLSKEDLYLRFLLRPKNFLDFCHTQLALLKQNTSD